MPTKRYSTEQIVSKLRQAEVELGRGLRVPQMCKKLGISEQTYYRWRKEYGGLRRGEGWRVNHKRVERLWRREGLQVPQKQPKRGRLWLTDGLCIRRRPAYRHHVWAYDFLTARTHDGRVLKILVVVDEDSRECLAIIVARRLHALEVLETLADLFLIHGSQPTSGRTTGRSLRWRCRSRRG